MLRIVVLLFCFSFQSAFGQEKNIQHDSTNNTKVRFSFTIHGRDTCINSKFIVKALNIKKEKEIYNFELNSDCKFNNLTVV